MPSSFSRFLSAKELQRVRELYMESLQVEAPEAPVADALTPVDHTVEGNCPHDVDNPRPASGRWPEGNPQQRGGA
jgi:hypothetical protein